MRRGQPTPRSTNTMTGTIGRPPRNGASSKRNTSFDACSVLLRFLIQKAVPKQRQFGTFSMSRFVAESGLTTTSPSVATSRSSRSSRAPTISARLSTKPSGSCWDGRTGTQRTCDCRDFESGSRRSMVRSSGCGRSRDNNLIDVNRNLPVTCTARHADLIFCPRIALPVVRRRAGSFCSKLHDLCC